MDSLWIADDVSLNLECLKSLSASIQKADVQAVCTRLQQPFSFASVEHEVSFMAIWRLLDFGTSFDADAVNTEKVSAKDIAHVRKSKKVMSICTEHLH